LSRMTRGPFTPPMVLYRIRGWTDIMRGSRLAMLAVLMSDSWRFVSLGGREFGRRNRRWSSLVWVTKLEVGELVLGRSVRYDDCRSRAR